MKSNPPAHPAHDGGTTFRKYGYRVEYHWLVDLPGILVDHSQPVVVGIEDHSEIPMFLDCDGSPVEAAAKFVGMVEKERPCPQARLRIVRMTRVEVMGG